MKPELAYRDQWLALLEKNGVNRPIDLQLSPFPELLHRLPRVNLLVASNWKSRREMFSWSTCPQCKPCDRFATNVLL